MIESGVERQVTKCRDSFFLFIRVSCMRNDSLQTKKAKDGHVQVSESRSFPLLTTCGETCAQENCRSQISDRSSYHRSCMSRSCGSNVIVSPQEHFGHDCSQVCGLLHNQLSVIRISSYANDVFRHHLHCIVSASQKDYFLIFFSTFSSKGMILINLMQQLISSS